MKIGLLASGLGLTSDDPNLPDLVRRQAIQFVKAGGCVTLTEWAALSDDEKAALIDAHDAVYDDLGDALDKAVKP